MYHILTNSYYLARHKFYNLAQNPGYIPQLLALMYLPLKTTHPTWDSKFPRWKKKRKRRWYLFIFITYVALNNLYSSISEKLDSKIYSPCLSIGCVLELIPHYLIPKYGKGQFNIANHQKEKTYIMHYIISLRLTSTDLLNR